MEICRNTDYQNRALYIYWKQIEINNNYAYCIYKLLS